MFWTVLNNLRSPENVGMIVRSHVAFGGADVIVIGPEPWRLRKRAQRFSRRLEKLCNFIYFNDEEAFFAWSDRRGVAPVAIEIGAPPKFLFGFAFPDRTALVVGNERTSLSIAFQTRCRNIVTIPQFGPVGSLNAAVSASIAMYELRRTHPTGLAIVNGKYWVAEANRPGKRLPTQPRRRSLSRPVASKSRP